jgi:RNA polymerase sigma factor (sigma-70 family)
MDSCHQPARGTCIEIRAGLAAIYGAHLHWLRTTLRKTFAPPGVANALAPEDIDDAIHEAFTRVLCLHQTGMAEMHTPAAYILVAARNSCVDMVRSRAARDRAAAMGVSLDAVSPEACDDSEGVRLRHDIVADYLAQLPKELLDVYELRFVEGLSQHNSAKRLAISRKRVRTLEALPGERLAQVRRISERRATSH